MTNKMLNNKLNWFYGLAREYGLSKSRRNFITLILSNVI